MSQIQTLVEKMPDVAEVSIDQCRRSRSKNSQKERTRSMSSHLDRASFVNKNSLRGKSINFSGDTADNLERAR